MVTQQLGRFSAWIFALSRTFLTGSLSASRNAIRASLKFPRRSDARTRPIEPVKIDQAEVGVLEPAISYSENSM